MWRAVERFGVECHRWIPRLIPHSRILQVLSWLEILDVVYWQCVSCNGQALAVLCSTSCYPYVRLAYVRSGCTGGFGVCVASLDGAPHKAKAAESDMDGRIFRLE